MSSEEEAPMEMTADDFAKLSPDEAFARYQAQTQKRHEADQHAGEVEAKSERGDKALAREQEAHVEGFKKELAKYSKIFPGTKLRCGPVSNQRMSACLW